MPEFLLSPEIWIAFFTLTALELVLGIDNIIFISILVDKLPKEQQELARRIGLFLAMFMRIGLLLLLSGIIGLTEPVLTLFALAISGRHMYLIAGGLFLIWKSTGEVHQLLEGEEGEASSKVVSSFAGVIAQIIVIDLVFSLDSIITAVGMVREVGVMIAAVVTSVGLMRLFARSICEFGPYPPTNQSPALSFLVVVGVVLIADGFGHHVPKGYIYFAMAFSVGVEMLNIRMRKKTVKPVDLREPYAREFGSD